MSYKIILCPIGHEENSRAAFETAARVARESHGTRLAGCLKRCSGESSAAFPIGASAHDARARRLCAMAHALT
jgi:hypothetical protein